MTADTSPTAAQRGASAVRLSLGLFLLFCVALCLRVTLFERGLVGAAPDERDYLAIARSIAESGSFSAGADRAWEERYRSPLFPYLIAPLVGSDTQEHRLRIVLAILASYFPLAAFALGAAARLPRSCCWLLAVFAALHPIHAQSSSRILPDALATCLLCVAYALELLASAQQSSPSGRSFTRPLSALTLGVTVALRTHLAIAAIPLVIRWLAQTLRRGVSRPLALLTLLAFLAVPLPLTILRSRQEGHFLPLTDAGAMLFWLGNSTHSFEYLDGTRNFELDFCELYGPVGDRSTPPFLPARDALRFIEEEPARWVGLKAQMLWTLWRPIPSFREQRNVARLATTGRTVVRLLKTSWRALVFSLLCAAGIAGCRFWRRTEPRLMFIALVLLTIFGVLFSPNDRYRMAIDIFLPALALSRFAGPAIATSR